MRSSVNRACTRQLAASLVSPRRPSTFGSRGEGAPLGQRRLDILHLGNRPRYLRRSFIAAP